MNSQFEDTPAMSFLYCPASRTYFWMENGVPQPDDARCWKWSRHFLTKIVGTGHWLLEGSIPEHVLFFLQMMRYFRVGFPTATEGHDSQSSSQNNSHSNLNGVKENANGEGDHEPHQ